MASRRSKEKGGRKGRSIGTSKWKKGEGKKKPFFFFFKIKLKT